MNINNIDRPKPLIGPPPGSVMVVNYSKGEATPTQWIADLESEMLSRAEQITQVTNAAENEAAYEAQAGLARYCRKVQEAETKAKAPVHALHKKIIALAKSLMSKVDSEGNRIGALVAEFQMAEKIRVSAARRAQDEAASILERDRDQKLAVAQSVAQIEAIQGEYREAIAAEAPPVEPIRVDGQVIKDDWEILITDVISLFRNHSHCVKLTPIIGEIKALLNEGIIVKGVTAKKITKASVRLGKEKPAIEI